MTAPQTTPPLQQFGRMLEAMRLSTFTDGQLLEQFAAHCEEDAFAALVHRHGRTVLGVCRRVLRDLHDAEDAFQATFLMLARMAGSLRRPDAVGSWLCAVAHRLAVKVRTRVNKRRARESALPPRGEAVSPDEPAWEMRAILDEEVSRLPESYRAVILLCCVEGKSRAAAAQQLGCKLGTVKIRLERARERLRDRLTRRGLTVSTSTVAALLGEGVAPATVPLALAAATTRAAPLVAAGTAAEVLSPTVLALAMGGLPSMSLTKSTILGILLFALAVGGGGALLLRQASGKEAGNSAVPGPDRPPANARNKPADQQADAAPLNVPGKPEPLPEALEVEWPFLDELALDTPSDELVRTGLLNLATKVEVSDETFLRRIFLDLVGVLPTVGELQAFLADKKPGKRARKVEELMNRRDFADYWDTRWAELNKPSRPLAEGTPDALPARVLATSPDGKLEVSVGTRLQVRMAATGKILWESRVSRPIEVVAFSGDGKFLAVADDKPAVFRTASGKLVWQSPIHLAVRKLTFSADGQTLKALISWGAFMGRAKVPADAALTESVPAEAALRRLLQSTDPEVRRLAAALLTRLEEVAVGKKLRHLIEVEWGHLNKPDSVSSTELEKKLDQLMKELEELRRDLRGKK